MDATQNPVFPIVADESKPVDDSTWHVALEGFDPEAGTVANVRVFRPDGRFFFGTIVPEPFPRLMLFENDGGSGKIGDVVIALTRNLDGEWLVFTDHENHYVTPDEAFTVVRATRASIDNASPARIGEAIRIGEMDSNSSRIGGEPIVNHLAVVDWNPEYAGKTVPVSTYVASRDSMGLATLMKSLATLPVETRVEIVTQL